MAAFEDDPVGNVFRGIRGNLLNVLETRNVSILAHGNVPIDRERYSSIRDVATPFINEVCAEGAKALGKPFQAAEQLPDRLDLVRHVIPNTGGSR